MEERLWRLTDADVLNAADLLDVDVPVIRAVLEVESAGQGFDPEGVRPTILFEPHIFYKTILFPKDRETAQELGLAYPKWGRRHYPKTQGERWNQLTKAVEIDREAALKSTSWGLGQIMGFNFRLAGYPNVSDFVAAMHASEGFQLLAMCSFIKLIGLADPLQRHNWMKFARGYNGVSYAQHGYHLKLKAAYEKWSVT